MKMNRLSQLDWVSVLLFNLFNNGGSHIRVGLENFNPNLTRLFNGLFKSTQLIKKPPNSLRVDSVRLSLDNLNDDEEVGLFDKWD